ncbi:MAG: hypothetical protein GF370_03615 [Candidatus Nealsonbacteria bacterium]|nr:hypothetical protein [Candidatus Nealsonbacteria bacterium]
MAEKAVYMCGVCEVHEKENGHLLCPECEKRYQEYVLEALSRCEQPETQLDWALSRTEENLREAENALQSIKDQYSEYWDMAYKEIQEACQNIRLPKEKFLGAVRDREILLLCRDGHNEVAELLEGIPERMKILASQVSWYKKLRSQSQPTEVA